MTTSGYAKAQTSLFVTGVPEEAGEDHLNRHIETIDRTLKIRLVNILRNYQTMRSKGLAIIEFATVEDGITLMAYFV